MSILRIVSNFTAYCVASDILFTSLIWSDNKKYQIETQQNIFDFWKKNNLFVNLLKE